MYNYYAAKMRRHIVFRENKNDNRIDMYEGNGRWIKVYSFSVDLIKTLGMVGRYINEVSEDEANEIFKEIDKSITS